MIKIKRWFWWIKIPELTKKEAFFLVGILLFAFLFRFIGTWKHLPFTHGGDEDLLLREALRFGQNLNIGEFVKSAPHMIINFSLYLLYFIFGKIIGKFQSPYDISVQFVLDPSPLYLIGRTASAFLSSITAFFIGSFVYGVTRRKEAFFL